MTDEQALALRAKMLGATLRMARLSAGRSLREAAACIGVSPSTLNSYETGSKSISLPELELLAFHLDVPLRRFWPQASLSQEGPSIHPTALIPLRQRMVAALLRSHRLEARLSIKQLAEAAHVRPGRLSAYEQGDHPVPLPHLEALASALGRSIEEYVDKQGPFGEWDASLRTMEALRQLPFDLREFVVQPANRTYLRLAKQLSELPVDKLRTVAQGLLDITL
ncbi:MAG: helix-turn-helix transcriptional regulator [Chloroflexota bacterium]